MRAFSSASAAYNLAYKQMLLASLAVLGLGCQPNSDAQSGGPQAASVPAAAPAVPQRPQVDTAAEPQAPEPIMISAGEDRWIKLAELPWEQWYLQYLDGKRVGYSHVLVQRSAIESDTQRLRVTRTDCLEVDNDGVPTRFKRTIDCLEFADGRVIDISDSSQTLDNVSHTQGKRLRGKFTATTRKSTAGENEEPISIAFDWDDTAWGVMGLQAVMMRHVPQPGEHLQADVFAPQLYKIAHAELLAGQFDLTALPGGKTQSLLAVDISLRSEDSGMLSRNWINERGEVLKTVALSGPNLSTFWTPAEVAYRTRDEFELADVLGGHVPLVGKLPTRQAQQVVYQVDRDAAAAGEDVFKLLAKSAVQSKVSLNALSAEATVKLAELQSPDTADASPGEPEECYLQASQWVPAKHAGLMKLAHQWAVGPQPVDDKATDAQAVDAQPVDAQPVDAQPVDEKAASQPHSTAIRLTRRVHQEIALVPLSRTVAGPLETLQRKSGDCVAHALLLTSLLRAQGIPARSVSGLRIDPDKPTQMQFHTWTEAWLTDRWLPLDSSIGALAGVDRLKFSDSCLSSDNPYEIILPVFRQMPGLQVRVKSFE